MKLIGKVLLTAVAYVVGLFLTGLLTPLLHLQAFKPMPGTSPEKSLLILTIATPLLAAGMIPIAAGLGRSWAKRWLALSGLLFVALGLNTVLELMIFSNMAEGQNAFLSLQLLLPSVLAAAVLAYPLSAYPDSPSLVRPFTVSTWAWRLVLAWLSFPAIYFLFGMMVAPFVVPSYNAGVAGLRIPSFDVIIRMQLLRSALFLAASLPLIVLWSKSRTHLLVALGIAHALTVGVFGLVQAYFLPTILRVAHSVEITADSFAYAAALTWLFTRSAAAAIPERKSTAAAAD